MMKMPDVKRKRAAMPNLRRLLLIGLLVLASAPAAAAQGPGPSSSQGPQFLVRASAADAAIIAARHNLSIVGQVDNGTGVITFLATTPAADATGLTQEFDADAEIAAFEENRSVRVPESIHPRLSQTRMPLPETLPDRTLIPYYGRNVWRGYANQTAATLINAVRVHTTLAATGGGIVAIIDTAIDVNHPALAGAIGPGFDFIRNQAPITSDLESVSQSTAVILEAQGVGEPQAALVNQSTAVILEQSTAVILEGNGLPAAFGHGTMVAGLVRLVAPTAQIMPLTAFTADGAGDVFDVVRAIYYAVDHGANVINMSFSLQNWSAELVRAVNYANEHDVVCVASAGNGGEETLGFPSAFRHVIGVGSTDNLDRRSAFSNYGNGLVRVSAPGEGLITAFPGDRYAVVSGTSFSAALVSGGAALLEQLVPGIEPNNAEEALSRAKRIGQEMGDGRIDLYSALQRAVK
jgi:subtilisin family serine protease